VYEINVKFSHVALLVLQSKVSTKIKFIYICCETVVYSQDIFVG